MDFKILSIIIITVILVIVVFGLILAHILLHFVGVGINKNDKQDVNK